jgi:biopolymer transport protein ExbD
MISRRRGLTRRSSGSHQPEISLTPLIDTALVLLVIFMVATPIMKNSLKIDLPKGYMKEDKQSNSHAPVVTLKGQEVRLNDEPLSLEALLEKLSKEIKNSKAGKVYVQCDVNVSSGTLVNIIDSIKYVAGVENVVLSTDRA